MTAKELMIPRFEDGKELQWWENRTISDMPNPLNLKLKDNDNGKEFSIIFGCKLIKDITEDQFLNECFGSGEYVPII